MEQPVLPLGRAGSDCRRLAVRGVTHAGAGMNDVNSVGHGWPPRPEGHNPKVNRQIIIDQQGCKGQVQKKSKNFYWGLSRRAAWE